MVSTVLGSHGCQKAFGKLVRAGQISIKEWKPSRNKYDWLGEGIYFWQASQTRAEKWAIEHFGEEADVLTAEIELGRCLDLLETEYHDTILATYKFLRTVYKNRNWSLPKNTKKRHDLDCLVINKSIVFMESSDDRQPGIVFQTVRGVFEEGRPIFPGSAIRTDAHIQIAVRDVNCIRLIT